MEGDFPWIKFTIICIPFIIFMWFAAPSIKWKILFTIAVPIGVGLAIGGKSINFHRGR